jgi:hypothetical protein
MDMLSLAAEVGGFVAIGSARLEALQPTSAPAAVTTATSSTNALVMTDISGRSNC